MTLRFLGTGTSRSLPKRGCHCPQCRGAKRGSKDARRTASVLVSSGEHVALIGPTSDSLKEYVADMTPDVVLTTVFDPAYCDWTLLSECGLALDEIDPVGGAIVRGNLSIESFPLASSATDMAVGYRIGTAVYCPCMMDIDRRYLEGVDTYIGDGTSLFSDLPWGHASVKRQLAILAEAGVRRAVFTHVGHERFSHDDFERRIQAMTGIAVTLAYDGMELDLQRSVEEMPYGKDEIPVAVKNQSKEVIDLFRRVFNDAYARAKQAGKSDEEADTAARQAAWAAVKNAKLEIKKESVDLTRTDELLKYLSEDTRRMIETELAEQGLSLEALVVPNLEPEPAVAAIVCGVKRVRDGQFVASVKRAGKRLGNVVLTEAVKIGDEINVHEENGVLLGLGPGGWCICPDCGEKSEHKPGVPCFETKCPKCGQNMIRVADKE